MIVCITLLHFLNRTVSPLGQWEKMPTCRVILNLYIKHMSSSKGEKIGTVSKVIT